MGALVVGVVVGVSILGDEFGSGICMVFRL